MDPVASVGIDAGAQSIKVCLIDEQGNTFDALEECGTEAVPSVAERAFNFVLNSAGLAARDPRVVATGVARSKIPFADSQVTESRSLACGIQHIRPTVSTVLDIGYLKASAITCRGGLVANTAASERCAAGTGAFIDVFSDLFEVSFAALEDLALRGSPHLEFNNTCAVFMESDAISLIHSGASTEDVVASAFRGYTLKLVAMANAIGLEDEVAVVGGMAKNKAVLHFLRATIGRAIFIPREPQMVSALGAALLGKKDDVACSPE